MSRKNIIAGNWKMNNFSAEVENFFNEIGEKVKDVSDREVVIAPSFLYLTQAKKTSEGKTRLLVGSPHRTSSAIPPDQASAAQS